jgi:Flp pilus assembly protein TadD
MNARAVAAYAAAVEGDFLPALGLLKPGGPSAVPPAAKMLVFAALVDADQRDEAASVLVGPQNAPAPAAGAAVALAAAGRPMDEPELNEDAQALAAMLADDAQALVQYALGMGCLEAAFETQAFGILTALDEAHGRPGGLITPMFMALSRGHFDEARSMKAKEIALAHSTAPEAWMGAARIAEAEGDAELEAEALQRAVESAPNAYSPLFRLAVFHEEQGELAAAEQAYRKLREIAPDNPVVLNNLAYILLERGQNAGEALALAERANELQPRQAHILHTLGLAQFRTGELEEAARNLALALEIRPGDPTLMLDYGVLLVEKGEEDQGRNYISRAVVYADQLGLRFPRREQAAKMLSGQ